MPSAKSSHRIKPKSGVQRAPISSSTPPYSVNSVKGRELVQQPVRQKIVLQLRHPRCSLVRDMVFKAKRPPHLKPQCCKPSKMEKASCFGAKYSLARPPGPAHLHWHKPQ